MTSTWLLKFVSLTVFLMFSAAYADNNHRALLIGIDEYAHSKVRDLSGAVNDVDRMRQVLIGKFDFSDENIRVLRNDEATREAILGAIRTHLIEADPSPDVAVIQFSGHGSQVKDTSGDELDGWDETIVPHDGRLPGVFDVTDDEINGLLDELSRTAKNITLIMDSCHSGSLARAIETGAIVRQIERDLRTPPTPDTATPQTRNMTETISDFRVNGMDYVLITGSRANELSNETKLGDKQHGILTYYLTQSLLSSGQNHTYRDIMEEVSAKVAARFPSQHPDLEGTLLDNKVLGVQQVIPAPYALVEPTGVVGEVIVDAGSMFGFKQGDQLEVFPPGTKDFSDPELSTSEIKLTSVHELESKGDVLGDAEVTPHSRTVLKKLAPPDFYVRLFVPEQLKDTPLGHGVIEQIEGHESVELTEEIELADLRLNKSGESLVLENRDLVELYRIAESEAEAVSKLVSQIAHWGRWHSILAIENPSPSVDVKLRIKRAGDQPGTPPPSVIVAGTKISIDVQNESDQGLHIIVLDLASDGSICVLYPASGPCKPREQADKLLAQKSLSIGPISSSVPEGRESSLDIVKVIASTTKISPRLFQLGAAPRDVTVGVDPDENPLERYVRQSVQGLTRNLATVSVEGWVSRQSTLHVVRSKVRNPSIVLHTSNEQQSRAVMQTLGNTRSFCDPGNADVVCDGQELARDPNMIEVISPMSRGGDDTVTSLGASFDKAYRLRELTGAERAEPMLEYEQSTANFKVDGQRSTLLSDDQHDSRAESDVLWSLKYVRVPEAWAKLRQVRNLPENQEASGVIVGHPDTGYLKHPEIWPADLADVPLWAEKGYDYYREDHDATDDLEDGRPLDNPAHGTGSSSAIISPSGCQLAGATKCPTGIARGARLVPMRVSRSVVQFSTKNLTEAILDAATGNGDKLGVRPDFLSIAMGGVPSWSLWKAVKKAEESGLLIIAAAGNYVRTVVWPARYNSVVAVAAINAGCQPWKHTSRGSAVDFSAPGESVWRGTIDESLTPREITGMGKGTTYATASTAGVAALWFAEHKGSAEFEQLKSDGKLTATFRELVQKSAWRPGTSQVPVDSDCDADAGWNSSKMGSGIIDAAALLSEPLTAAQDGNLARNDGFASLPVWSSLYAPEVPMDKRFQDYRKLFRLDENTNLDEVAIFEVEIGHHYVMNARVTEALDLIVGHGNPGEKEFVFARQVLKEVDLSSRLREKLQ